MNQNLTRRQIVILVAVAASAVVFVAVAIGQRQAEGRPSMNADVKFNGQQFLVANKAPTDDSDWFRVTMTLNGSYEFSPQEPIRAGDTLTVPAAEFATASGTRFNPYGAKPLQFSISANVGGIQKPRAIYSGGF